MLDMIALALGAVANVVLWRALMKTMDEHEKPTRRRKLLFGKKSEPRRHDQFSMRARTNHPADRQAAGRGGRPRDPGP